MSPDTIAALVIIGGAVLIALPSLLVRCMEWIDRRDAMWLAESDADFGPLPAVDAPDEDFTAYGAKVVGLRESDTFARIAAVIAHNEARRADWDAVWDVMGGGAA